MPDQIEQTESRVPPAANVKGASNGILAGLVGRGIQGSLSPKMHQTEAQALGLRLVYKLLDVDQMPEATLESILESAQQLGFAGLNVTVPFKQSVMPLLDDLSDEAAQVGAVNTVIFRDGRRTGYNTDLVGFTEGFDRKLGNASIDNVALIGAGGAGFAAATAMLRRGTQSLRVFDADASRTHALLSHLIDKFPNREIVAADAPMHALAGADGVVNATPVGMAKYPGTPFDLALLRPDLWVYEIIYFPLETELLKQARAMGCQTVDGSCMAVLQAAAAFDLFTGRSADRERMLRQFRSATK